MGASRDSSTDVSTDFPAGSGIPRSLILGTAGHIDHGKTALVRALTGIDTDRLAEEKERGITIDLGFAEFGDERVRFGVVDVPGHEGFVRNMLAGATGMDVVLLVVAADEGVMPQTREHLAILELLQVERVVAALSKSDLVEPEWLDLVAEEVREELAPTGFADAPLVPTAVGPEPRGIPELRDQLLQRAAAVSASRHDPDDVVHLPIDRVFTVKGTGTVVTGTLWSGRLAVGDTLRIVPGAMAARVRGLQVHGRDVATASAGSRTAVALAGDGIDREHLSRGQCLVAHPGWGPSSMLTVLLRLVPDTGWTLDHGQRVRVHLGTAEVMARCVVLDEGGPDRRHLEQSAHSFPDSGGIARRDPDGPMWAQLRLETPVCARVGQRLVLRSFSPITTIAGGVIVEAWPPKRRRGEVGDDAARLAALVRDDPGARVEAALTASGGSGLPMDLLPLRTGLPPATTEVTLSRLRESGALVTSDGRAFAPEVVTERAEQLRGVVDRIHAEQSWRDGVPLAELRAAASPGEAPGLVDGIVTREAEQGRLALDRGIVSRPGFEPVLTPAQEDTREALIDTWRNAGLEAPRLDDLPQETREDPAFLTLVRGLEDDNLLVELESDLLIWRATLVAAVERVRTEFGGRTGLGPADFREVIPVSRRHLMPILAWMDRTGVTRFVGGERTVVTGEG